MPAKCKYANCTTCPSFGKEGQKREYCSEHSPDGYVDVVHKRCKHANCTTRPSIGKKGHPP